MAGGSPPGASLVARTIDVLGAFDQGHERLTLAELSSRAGLAPPTCLRIARQLVATGALTRAGDGRYAVGGRMWDIGLLAPVRSDLREVAAPFLQDLHAATRATVHLAIRDGDEVLYLDRLSGSASVPVVSRVGSRLPMHATGVGKVLLAHAPPDVVERVLSDLRPVTAYTITAPGILARQLADVREHGFATTREEMSLGACSIAVPIRQAGDVVASVAVVVADFRRERARLVTALTVTANGIGRSLEPASGEASTQ
jgi:DNA-binding IclR family transcriptional regulator